MIKPQLWIPFFVLCICAAVITGLAYGTKHGPVRLLEQSPGTVVVKASWYGATGNVTSFGKPYDGTSATCAADFFPQGTALVVSTLPNTDGSYRQVTVKVADRLGPKARGAGIGIDLSPTAFQWLAPLSKGVIKVAVSIQP